MDRDQIGARIEAIAPHRLQQRRAADGAPFAYQMRQDRELDTGQADRPAAPGRPSGGEIEQDVACLQPPGWL